MAADVGGVRACVVHEVVGEDLTRPEREPGPSVVAEVVMVWAHEAARLDVEALTGGRPVTGYRVEERPQWDDGLPADGVTRISFVRRRPGLTRRQFADHWTNVHAPLARRHHPALCRYVQNVVVEPVTLGAAEVDGIAELGFRSIEDMTARMYDSPEGAAIIRADVHRFIDTDTGWRVLTRPSSRPTNP